MDRIVRTVISHSNSNQFAALIWLIYYNDYLKERRIITEETWLKMRQLIMRKYEVRDTIY